MTNIKVNPDPSAIVEVTQQDGAEIIVHLDSNKTVIKPEIISGARGKSAYEDWLAQGYVGSIEDFFNWLRQTHYVHEQLNSDEKWEIEHNLGKYPSVTVVDSGRSVVVGEITYDNLNKITIKFEAEFSGFAYLN